MYRFALVLVCAAAVVAFGASTAAGQTTNGVIGGVLPGVTVTDLTLTTGGEVVRDVTMQMLPLESRQPIGLALLLPGTSQDAVRPRKFNANIGAGAFTMGSALLVDGVWNKEGNTAEPRQDFPQAAIREFRSRQAFNRQQGEVAIRFAW